MTSLLVGRRRYEQEVFMLVMVSFLYSVWIMSNERLFDGGGCVSIVVQRLELIVEESQSMLTGENLVRANIIVVGK